MPARPKAQDGKKASEDDVQSVLARSAQGASILISLQVGSRALTFMVNQVLIRFLSPELLGISAQLELFNISVLTFCRESIRIALARQGGPQPTAAAAATTTAATGGGKKKNDATRYEPARRAQGAINLSYVAIALGPVFALLFTWFLFWRKPSAAADAVPYYHQAHRIYVLATLLELVHEPAFAIAAQQNLYGLRASAEGTAAVARALVSCALAFVSSSQELGLGALPFAMGQLAFAVVINAVYYASVIPRAAANGYAARWKAVPFPTRDYTLGYFHTAAVQLAQNLYAQSGLKFFLTQGDSYIMNLAPISTLGVYSLATNYGALLARMVFQPIEESSRGIFGGLLAHHTNEIETKTTPPDPSTKKESADPKLISAREYLVTVLRLYSLLSVGLVTLLPSFAPMLLSIVAGSRWAKTEAPAVLGAYAYYLPLLAFNGILEAFVAATASSSQLQTQNRAMVGFTLGFFGAAFLIVRVGDGGALGVVAANAVNMAMRIVWSYSFVQHWFNSRNCSLKLSHFAPSVSIVAAGVPVAGILHWLKAQGRQDLVTAAEMIALGGSYGLLLLFLERRFLAECYRLLRPKRNETKTKTETADVHLKEL